MVLSKIFCIFEINNAGNTYVTYNYINPLNHKIMLHSLWTLIGVVLLIVVVLIAAFYITKTILFIRYGWPSKFSFSTIKFVTIDKKEERYAVAYVINKEYYRAKLHDVSTMEQAKQQVPSIVDLINKYNDEKEILAASHKTSADRILEVNDVKLVPTWVFKIMNFNIRICSSKVK